MSTTNTGTGSGPAEHQRYDVVVVGGGNAGFCAAHAARQAGARVLLLEKGDAEHAGGNSFYTAGAFRIVHDGPDRLASLVDDDVTVTRLPQTRLAPYTTADFHADMRRVTDGRCDPALTGILVDTSADTVRWLADIGVRWRLMYERQAYRSGDTWTFFGGLALGTVDGGKGLITQHTAAARQAGVAVTYGATGTGALLRGALLSRARLSRARLSRLSRARTRGRLLPGGCGWTLGTGRFRRSGPGDRLVGRVRAAVRLRPAGVVVLLLVLRRRPVSRGRRPLGVGLLTGFGGGTTTRVRARAGPGGTAHYSVSSSRSITASPSASITASPSASLSADSALCARATTAEPSARCMRRTPIV